MKADGSVIIEADLTVDKAEKNLEKLKKSIEKTEDDIDKTRKARDKANQEGIFKAAELDREKAKLAELRKELQQMRDISKDKTVSDSIRAETKMAITGAKADVEEQATRVRLLQTEYNKVTSSVDKYDRKLEDATDELNQQKSAAGALIQKINSVSEFSRKMAKAQAEAEENARRFGLRLKEVMRSALVFTLITQSLAKFREWTGKVIQTDNEAVAAIGRLKGALLTLAQPLVQVIIPAFTTLVNLLAAVAGEVAKLVSALFGATIEQSAEAAKSLQSEVDALNATGAAAKKAGKSLASFDEINKLSNTGGASGGGKIETTATDFAWMSGISEKLQQIARDVLLIASGLALWKISSSIPGTLGTILGKLGLIMIALGGVLLFYEGFTDAWENGVDWGNFALMLGGVAAAALALNAAFGPMSAGVSLVVGGVLLLSAGFKDLIENGTTLQNVLAIIAGIIGSGLGIRLITGSSLPLLIAGIMAVITAMVAWQGNMEEFALAFKEIFGGIVDFFTGVFTGDMELAMKGLGNVIRGVLNAVIIAFESFVNTAIDGLNWLISKANSIANVVGIGSFIPTIPNLTLPRVPYLAQGAVIPPNREFMAVLGDQTHGRNLEAPEGLIRQIVREESGGMNTELLRAILDAIREGKVLVVDDVQFAKLVYSANKSESRRVGVSLAGG